MNKRRSFILFLTLSLAIATLVNADQIRAAPGEPFPNPVVDGAALTYLSLVLNWTAEGDQKGDELGYSVGVAGDVNGDGYDDVIVGAPKDTCTVDKEGIAYVFHGSPAGLSASPNWRVGSEQKGADFGASVGAAGDVNGDGYDDVVVGAYRYNNGQPAEGRAFVFYGSPSGLSHAPGWTFESDQSDANLGYSVGSAGDVNGDGYDDVIVGARGYTQGQLHEGAAFVFCGSETGLGAVPAWSAESDQAYALFGASVGAAGDVNGDGYGDVVVGAPHYDVGENEVGAVFVFHGSAAGLSSVPNWTAAGDQAEADFGASVARAGDLNRDGYGDLIVGAPQYDTDQPDVGAAFVFHGSIVGLNTTADWRADSDQGGSVFGISVGRAGDVNGDGYGDVVVGAPRYTQDQSLEGAAFVFRGSATGLSASAEWVAEGNKAETEFGHSAGTAGDVNGDGSSDLIVGAPQYRHETELRGRAFVYHGLESTQPAQYRTYLPLLLRGL